MLSWCGGRLRDAGEKLFGADDKLLRIALQHHRRLPGSQGRAALDEVAFPSKDNRSSGRVTLEFQVVVLRIDLFHFIHCLS